MNEIVFKVTIMQEQIEDRFESAGVKFSKAKLNELIKMLGEGTNPDVLEVAEDAILETIEEYITEEWGE
jgi:hypothetical protein